MQDIEFTWLTCFSRPENGSEKRICWGGQIPIRQLCGRQLTLELPPGLADGLSVAIQSAARATALDGGYRGHINRYLSLRAVNR